MEGGKVMKTRIMFKSVFLVILLILLIGLTIIIFSDNNIYSKNYPKIEDYKITYDETCSDSQTLIYEDNENKYYINCDETNVHINWDYGKWKIFSS